MASAAGTLKSAVLRFMPDAVLLPLKRRRYLAAVRTFWSPEAAIMVDLVSPGDHVLDIGAHAGWYTKVLSEAVGPTGRVHSFEPVPHTFSLLTANVSGLALSNVTLYNCAASRVDGSAVMTVPRYPTGGENYYRASLLDPADPSVPLRQLAVELRAVDSLPALPRPVTLMKIDVEGHEADVLEGAARTIERDRPALCVEVSGDPDVPGSSSQALVASLARWGYAPHWLDGGRLVPRSPGDRSVNYFFLTALHLARLAARGKREAL